MFLWRPDLYTTNKCQLCLDTIENNYHVFNCPKTIIQQGIQWERAIDKVNDWGQKALKEATNNWNINKLIQQQKQKYISSTEPKWSQSTSKNIWESLFFIKGAHLRFSYSDGLVSEDSIWNVQHLYQGLVPINLIKKWKILFNTSEKIATYIAFKFCQEIEKIGCDIWTQRCEKVIDWEKSINISQKKKKSRPTTESTQYDFSSKKKKNSFWNLYMWWIYIRTY
jgi:hypothetical protein